MRQSWKYIHKNIHYSKCKLKNKNKLNFTVLLIPRLLSPLTNYKSTATEGHYENLKQLLWKMEERDVPSVLFFSPFKVHPYIKSPLNLLKIF
jgi:hypothetical protein